MEWTNPSAAAVTTVIRQMSGEGVIQLTPLYGANDTDAMCYLLEIDDCRIMLDCGWDERFDERHLEALATAINDVDCVLVSHADISHLGALPYAIGQLGLDCPIYSTQPVWRMGSMFMYDAWQRLTARAEFDLFSSNREAFAIRLRFAC